MFRHIKINSDNIEKGRRYIKYNNLIFNINPWTNNKEILIENIIKIIVRSRHIFDFINNEIYISFALDIESSNRYDDKITYICKIY
jgi:hypothetical protein